MDRACLAVDIVARDGSFQDGEGARTGVGGGEDLAEVDNGSFFKLWLVESEERM